MRGGFKIPDSRFQIIHKVFDFIGVHEPRKLGFQIPDSPPAGAHGHSAGGQADSRFHDFSVLRFNFYVLGERLKGNF